MALVNQKMQVDDYFEAFLFHLQDQAWFIDFVSRKSGVKQSFYVLLRKNREQNTHSS